MHDNEHRAIAARLSALAAEARALGTDHQAAIERQLQALVDVTADVPGLEPEDRVYRGPDGVLVKVKVLEDDETDHGLASALVMTPSIVGADGKALTRPDGRKAVWKDHKHHHHVHAFGLGDPEADEERSRRLTVLQGLWAEGKHQLAVRRADGPTQGVARRSAFKARKAAEAMAAGAAPEAAQALAEDLDPTAWTPPPVHRKVKAPTKRHPSGRRFLLFPGFAIRGGETVMVSPAELAAAYNVKLGQCVRFSPAREHTYFEDLIELHPLEDGATYPDYGPAAAP